jgi:hypothetical protein
MTKIASCGPGPIPPGIARNLLRFGLWVGLLALVLAPAPGCGKQPGPVAVRPIASAPTPDDIKDKEKNPLITRD